MLRIARKGDVSGKLLALWGSRNKFGMTAPIRLTPALANWGSRIEFGMTAPIRLN